MKRIEISIKRTVEDPLTLKAWVHTPDLLCVHRTPGKKALWDLTHIPTGLRLAQGFRTRSAAVAVADVAASTVRCAVRAQSSDPHQAAIGFNAEAIHVAHKKHT